MKPENRTTINADIPSMLKAAINTYDLGGRRSGRTMRELKLMLSFLMKNYEAKATYVCPSNQKTNHVKAFWLTICGEHHISPEEMKLLDKRLEFCTVQPSHHALYEALSGPIRASNQLFFDHSWLIEYYANQVDNAMGDLIGVAMAFQRHTEPTMEYRGPRL